MSIEQVRHLFENLKQEVARATGEWDKVKDRAAGLKDDPEFNWLAGYVTGLALGMMTAQALYEWMRGQQQK